MIKIISVSVSNITNEDEDHRYILYSVSFNYPQNVIMELIFMIYNSILNSQYGSQRKYTSLTFR